MARTMTITPGEELRQFVEGLVEAGIYQTNSEVVREGLRMLQEKYAASQLTLLRQLIDEGEQSGEAVTWNSQDFIRRMNQLKDAEK
ncbi:type II toxin-antitoxin system ParD family antitoxin [Pragia fontium]|uniref:Antitoxin ParD n=2 Tax=Pragia fontium TaxID=82985 RepID=A0AAJ5BGE4_9GAMM|nr:type II toxin-antitoxin system ParD family antitoxin [Pragia fontium]AKJ41878.1 hypothetical protein QQ39_07080 [Pragia fontium]SFC38802.1 antitoxin ParD1/3/4 [Pragia fontium DSM 5563 = ATCC 49100]SUB82101.1 Antitoxin ParD1 [Pragia fontium]VEJ54746.1 Antitoxin ParD1 [Pragia fontium]GKX62101.1 transcriptional regulator [Pragia fontium]